MELVKQGAVVNSRDNCERTPLHHAAALDSGFELVKELLKQGADVNARDKDNKTPCHHAVIHYGDVQLVKELFKHGADVNAKDMHDITALHHAVICDRGLKLIKELLKQGADVNARDEVYTTPLHQAVIHGRGLELVKELLKQGADVHARDEDNTTPLHYAAIHDSLELVKELLKQGANVNDRDEYNKTPLHYAVLNDVGLELTKELLKQGADVNARDKNNTTPLHHAAIHGSLELVKELLKQGANVNATNDDNKTPLHYAVLNDMGLELVKELLKRGADVNTLAYIYNMTLFRLAEKWDGLTYAKLLIKFALLNNDDKNNKKVITFDPFQNKNKQNVISSYIDDCICEVLQMKMDKVLHFSLFELVTKQFSRYVFSNSQLFESLAKIDYSFHYSIYKDVILDSIKLISERAVLFGKLSALRGYTKFDLKNLKFHRELDDDSVCDIIQYLSNDDLSNFIVAFKEPKKVVSHSLRFKSKEAPYSEHIESFLSSCVKRPKLE